MKNKKYFQKLMLSAATLLMVMPLTSQSQNAQARELNTKGNQQPGMITTYGIARDAKSNKGGHTGSSGNRIGIDLRRNKYGVNGTQNAKYVYNHKLSGFLKKNGSIQGKPFGPTKSKFRVSMEGDKGHQISWVVYMNPKNSEAGKVGMYYKNALIYYPNNKKAKAKVLDARLFWDGSYRPQGVGANNSLHFSTKNISIKEPYQGAANFTLKLYYKGKPFSVKTHITQTDIDHKQGLIFDTPQYLIYDQSTELNAGHTESWNTHVSGKTTVFGDDGKSMGKQGTVLPEYKEGQIDYIPEKSTSSFNVTFVHSYESVPWRYQTDAKFASSNKSSSPYDPNKLKKLPSDYDTRKYYHNVTDSSGNTIVSGGQADYFGFEFDKGKTPSPYPIYADKLVNTKDGHYKKADKKKPLNVKDSQKVYFDIHAQLKGPSSALVKKKNNVENYDALPVKDALKTKGDPNIGKAGLTDAKKNKQRLVLRDYLDPRFELAGKPKIYYAIKWNDTNLSGKRKSASKYFYVHSDKNSKGQTVVDAVMKSDAMKFNSDAWWKDYHLVIPVKLKKDAQPANGSKSKGWLLLDNKAYMNNDGGGKVWTKFKFTHETVKADGKPGVDSKKDVYDSNLADPDKIGHKLQYGTNDGNAKMLGDLVNPDQYLYYRLRFTIRPMKAYQKKQMDGGKIESDRTDNGGTTPDGDELFGVKDGDPLIEDNYKNLEITDDLSDRFRNKSAGQAMRDVDKVQVVMDDASKLNNPTQNHKFSLVGGTKLKVNLTKNSDSDILKALSKSDKKHYIYVQYRVRIRPNEVPDHKAKQDLKLDPTDDQYSDSHKVQNQAKIEGTFEEHKRKLDSKSWTIITGTDKDGHPITDTETIHGVTKWDSFKIKKLSSYKNLMNKTKTNKTINWIHVEPTSIHKVPISWANTNDVINDDTMVWKVQADLPSIRSYGGKLKTVTLKDTVKSNEKLDPSQTWSADNDDDEDLATGTYQGPQVFRNGENVTSKFSISSSGKEVIARANDNYLKELAESEDKAEDPNHFTLAIPGKIVEKRKLNASGTFDKLTGASDKAVLEIEKQKDKDGDKQVIETNWEQPPHEYGNDTQTTIKKSVKAVKDLTTGKDVNVTGDGQHMNPQHKYEVTYQLGTDRDNRNLKISDPLPENSKLVKGSLSVPNGFNTSGTTDTDIHIAYNGNANALANKGTMDNPTVETMTYKVTVNPNSDWSDYYNSETRSGYGTMMIGNQNGQVDDNSYLVIPNTATMTSRGGSNSSIATFHMGLQQFAVKQYIVQDDDKFGAKSTLDPSHYVDTTRNDKTAVTTAVKVQLPNYLKLDKLTANKKSA